MWYSLSIIMSFTRYFFFGESVGSFSIGTLNIFMYRVLRITARISQTVIGIYLHARLMKLPNSLVGKKKLTGPIIAPPTMFVIKLNQWKALQYGDCFFGSISDPSLGDLIN